mmetsp:Transcript_37125/g.97778  ORF Transcript_37125/g.97778 Transcript_37125/m.97778 type:complete len:207 (+) Transcript_37125:93-713(+)
MPVPSVSRLPSVSTSVSTLPSISSLRSISSLPSMSNLSCVYTLHSTSNLPSVSSLPSMSSLSLPSVSAVPSLHSVAEILGPPARVGCRHGSSCALTCISSSAQPYPTCQFSALKPVPWLLIDLERTRSGIHVGDLALHPLGVRHRIQLHGLAYVVAPAERRVHLLLPALRPDQLRQVLARLPGAWFTLELNGARSLINAQDFSINP